MPTTARFPLFLLALTLPVAAQSVDDPRLVVEEVWTGLARPTAIVFLGPGEALVTENLTGRVRHVVEGGGTATVLDLDVASQGGLGIELAPDFERSGHVFLFTATTTGGDGGTWDGIEVTRRRWDGQALVEPTAPLFTVPVDPAQANPNGHNSGVLRFGPDGMLHGQVGDKDRGEFARPRIEQNTSAAAASGAGGIFRLAPDGSVPADNPFAAHPDPRLRPWTVIGFRNSLGMAFDPLSGDLWFGENGPAGWDELNRAVPGMNSGWRLIMGPDARDATYVENGDTAWDAADLVNVAGAVYRDPEFSWSDCIGVTALEFLGRRFPEDLWYDLVVGETNNGNLYRFELDAPRTGLVLTGGLADGVADDAAERDGARFASAFGVATDLRVGPDGYLYALHHYQGRVLRVRPLVDLFDPSHVKVTRGTKRGGTPEALWMADGEVWTVACTEPVAAPGPVPGNAVASATVETRFELHGTDPERIDLRLVARRGARPARWSVAVLHVPSGTFVEQHAGPLARSDTEAFVPDLPNPAEWIDGEGRVLVRVTATAPGGASAVPQGQPRNGEPGLVHLDLARLEVAW